MKPGDRISWRAINGEPEGSLLRPIERPVSDEEEEETVQLAQDWLVQVKEGGVVIVNEDSMIVL